MTGFRIEQLELSTESLEAGGGGLSLVHLSDLHLRRWRTQHGRLVEAVNSRDPDLVFLTGDILTNRPGSLSCAGHLLPMLRARSGVFAVRGNWEVRYAPPLRHLRRLMSRWGITLIVNEARQVRTSAGLVRVAGADDLNRGWPDLEAALQGGKEHTAFSVLLSHAPLAATLLPPGHGVDLMLSGHTHGGQVRVPPLWRWFLPRGHGGFTNGLYKLGGLNLYVNRGYGGVGAVPLRVNCPPEVTFFRVLPSRRAAAGARVTDSHP